jgi:hypothetical protein
MPESYRNNSTVHTSLFTSWQESVPRLLDATGLPDRLAAEKKIIIKPNLVEPLKPPITTPVELIAALVDFIHASLPHLEIIIGEGCGSSSKNTLQIAGPERGPPCSYAGQQMRPLARNVPAQDCI